MTGNDENRKPHNVRSSEVGQFLFGLVLTVGLYLTFNLLVVLVPQPVEHMPTWVALSCFAILALFVAFWLARSGRKYIAIGMLTALLVPLLLYGACFLFLG